MAEEMLSSLDKYMLELPYQQRILQRGREEGLAEGLVKGKEAGLAEGLAEGLVKGKEEGVLTGLREAILEAIIVCFNPPASEYRQVSRQLEVFTDREVLQHLLAAAIQSEDMATFVAHLTEELPEAEK